MCARCVFDFGGADVEAAADDDALEPPEDIVPSVLGSRGSASWRAGGGTRGARRSPSRVRGRPSAGPCSGCWSPSLCGRGRVAPSSGASQHGAGNAGCRPSGRRKGRRSAQGQDRERRHGSSTLGQVSFTQPATAASSRSSAAREHRIVDALAEAGTPCWADKMNVQIIADPFGRLLWASPALPGAVHDIRALGAVLDAALRAHLTGGLEAADPVEGAPVPGGLPTASPQTGRSTPAQEARGKSPTASAT